MPLYEYQCTKCHRRTEKIEKVSGPHLKKCPHCGAKVEPMITAPAIQFKGSGWYVTDYAGKSGGGGDSGSKDAKDSGDAKGKADSKESSGDSGKAGGVKESSGKESSATESGAKDKKAAKKKD